MRSYSVAAYLICLITAVSSGMGVGGGGILTLYLSVFTGMEQICAQGVNLLDFTFALSPSAVINTVRYKPDVRMITFLTFCGTTGCILGSILSSYAPDILLRKCCGAFLAMIGTVSLYRAAKEGKS